MVVFAAAKAPADPPDIAVGLALAAHLARANKVSIVVVPRYLEANPGLEIQLREQPQVIQDGIVLGEPNIMPEDTRALLRQLLTTTDQQSFLSGTRDTLGSVAPLVAALLALFGLKKVVDTAPKKDEWKDLGGWLGKQGSVLRGGAFKSAVQGKQEQREPIVETTTKPAGTGRIRKRRKSNKPQPPLADWLDHLDEKEKNGLVTIRLVSGWETTARIPERFWNDLDAPIIRLDVTDPANNGKEQKYAVLVRVEDIESIRVPLPEASPSQIQPSPDQGKTSPAHAGTS